MAICAAHMSTCMFVGEVGEVGCFDGAKTAETRRARRAMCGGGGEARAVDRPIKVLNTDKQTASRGADKKRGRVKTADARDHPVFHPRRPQHYPSARALPVLLFNSS